MEKEVREFHKKHGFLLDERLANHCNESSKSALEYLAEKLEVQVRSVKMSAFGSSRTGDERLYRVYLMLEELQEVVEALAQNDEVLLADALGDLKYVTVGTDITYGIPGQAVFDEIHKSNMTKIERDITTNHRMRDKGPDYVPPDIAKVLKGTEDADH